jgi:hypothetical protein
MGKYMFVEDSQQEVQGKELTTFFIINLIFLSLLLRQKTIIILSDPEFNRHLIMPGFLIFLVFLAAMVMDSYFMTEQHPQILNQSFQLMISQVLK